MKRERRRARSLALQVLYEVDSVDHAPEEVIAFHLGKEESLGEEARSFMQRLVFGAIE